MPYGAALVVSDKSNYAGCDDEDHARGYCPRSIDKVIGAGEAFRILEYREGEGRGQDPNDELGDINTTVVACVYIEGECSWTYPTQDSPEW